MDYGKIDAALAIALDEVQDRDEKAFTVFVQTSRTPDLREFDFLRKMGIQGDADGRSLFTTTLSSRAISELSNQPWIKSLSLSKKLRPLTSEQITPGLRMGMG